MEINLTKEETEKLKNLLSQLNPLNDASKSMFDNVFIGGAFDYIKLAECYVFANVTLRRVINLCEDASLKKKLDSLMNNYNNVEMISKLLAEYRNCLFHDMNYESEIRECVGKCFNKTLDFVDFYLNLSGGNSIIPGSNSHYFGER